jgi:hypothetical protein
MKKSKPADEKYWAELRDAYDSLSDSERRIHQSLGTHNKCYLRVPNDGSGPELRASDDNRFVSAVLPSELQNLLTRHRHLLAEITEFPNGSKGGWREMNWMGDGAKIYLHCI